MRAAVLFAVFVILAAAGCEKQPALSDGLWSRVVLVQLEDGTHCAVAETASGGSVALSCDWQDL